MNADKVTTKLVNFAEDWCCFHYCHHKCPTEVCDFAIVLRCIKLRMDNAYW